MQRIGCVLHISSGGSVILKAESLPWIGDKVVDEKKKPVGTVFDIFGSAASPYVSVKANMKDTNRLVNCVLYAIPASKLRKRRGKRG
ncbi:MAG: H/ACA RNA-protein complex protein Gar1 [Candidatus Bathyarchaeota archaeon]|nr:MAG: H/ACA RNA-protein complex protein Gar1 [Candidatus Bathyarchaeota archaeon]